jgi:KUP system potassium uptake protein
MTVSHTAVPNTRSESAKFLALLVGSVGVVYGDIGTSPLYAFREALRPFSANAVQQEHVIGLISLMIWTLTIIVTFKYVLFLLRADNEGEGGTLSLLALLMKATERYMPILFFAGLIGSALFIGDAMITPALSVMSALEGMKLVTPAFSDYVLPLSAGDGVGRPLPYRRRFDDPTGAESDQRALVRHACRLGWHHSPWRRVPNGDGG